MKKKILLPSDFSKNAWNALLYASELYKKEEVDFYILNAYGEDQKKITQEHTEKELQKIKLRISMNSVNPNHTFFTLAVEKFLLKGIKETVESKDIKMVIMSTKGMTDAMDVIYGRNTIEIMENIRNCPVLVIPRNFTYQAPNEIVFPTSFKTHFKERELKHLFEISKLTNAPVRILHMMKEKKLTPEQNNNKDLLEYCFYGLNYSFHWVENQGVQKGLLQFVAERNSQMIAFINKKHHFFENIFSKPMVKELGENANVPILALHDLRD
jgi:hypothetical protein